MHQARTVRLFGIDVAAIDFDAAIARIAGWARERPARLVFTCNLDHVMKLRSDAAFRRAYADADLVVGDGMPFVWLAKLSGDPLPGRISGSELIVPLCHAAVREGLSVFLLGSTEDRLARAEASLAEIAPGLRVAGRHSPPFGFRSNPEAQAEAAHIVARARPDILFVALGPPTQEIWSANFRDRLDCGVAICIGAGLDFLSGDVQRAPRWMQVSGLEWAWRTLQEPRRLAPRYGRIIVTLPRLLADHVRDRRRHRSG
ncbi:N-acetylglucosaminyldiphosphoundecaprenol N-acetyl-beta-D-mannosaminyltransferase [Amorphus suaedae]